MATDVALDRDVSTKPSSRAAALLERGRTVGRYVVLDRIGAGGMGMVYSAYDPELDRKLALKVLLPELSGGSEGRGRLLREAKAMAKLGHPNVVTVHDVTSEGDQIYIAMEFVAGPSLRQWLATPRAWRDVLEVFEGAARGLAAAHAQGIVHRDFKPDNVMVDDDGRARVMDFGLARMSTTVVHEELASAALGSSPTTLDSVITRGGAIMGTPAYMSPEQLAGQPIDGRADQFAFCVALWEGLYGARPHKANTLASLLIKISGGELQAPPRSEVPGWVRNVVARGLRPDPAERWASMDALVDALHHDPTRWRRRAAVAVGVSALVLGGLGARAWSHHVTELECAQAGAAIDELWNDERAATLADAFAATGFVHASPSFAKARPSIDAWVAKWRGTAATACLATERSGERSPQLYALTRQCLDDQELVLEASLESFATPSRGVVGSAFEVASALPDIDRCMDDAWLQRQPTPPDDPAAKSRLTELRRILARADVRFADGDYAEAEALGSTALELVLSLEGHPLEAHARTRMGLSLLEVGRQDEAAKALEDAYFVGVRTAAVEPAVDAALGVMKAMIQLQHHEDALLWGRLADVTAEGVGSGELRRAERKEVLGNALLVHGDYEAAITVLEEGLASRIEELGALHPFVAVSRTMLSMAYVRSGRYDEAEAEARGAVELLVQTLGPEHPNTARGRINLADVLLARGQLEAAAAELATSLEILSVTLAPEDQALALVHNNLAGVLQRQGKTEEALSELREAHRLLRASMGAENPNVALIQGNIAALLGQLGRPDEAEAAGREAIRAFERNAGPEHPQSFMLRNNLAIELTRRGEHARAEAVLREGLEAALQAVGADDPRTAAYDYALGVALLSAGRVDDARALFETAWAIHEITEIEPIERADTAWALAKLLTTDPARARALATRARELFAAIEKPKRVAEIDAWLAALPPDASVVQ